MNKLKLFILIIERFIGFFLALFSVVVLLQLTGMAFVIFAEISIIGHLFIAIRELFSSEKLITVNDEKVNPDFLPYPCYSHK